MNAMWRPQATDRLTDYLRFLVRAIGFVIGIAVAISLAYIAVKSCFFGVDYLDHTLFSQPWY
jgi:hypothetical protein